MVYLESVYVLFLLVPLVIFLGFCIFSFSKQLYLYTIIFLVLTFSLFVSIVILSNGNNKEIIEKKLDVISVDEEYYYKSDDTSGKLEKLKTDMIRSTYNGDEICLIETTVIKFRDVFNVFRIYHSFETYYVLLAPTEVINALTD